MAQPPLTDAQLIARVVVHDDRHAFSELVRRHQSAVRTTLRRLTAGNLALADDLAQESFMLAYRNLKSFRQEAQFSTWLYRIATNLALNGLRRPHRREPHASHDAEGGPTLVSDQAPPEAFVDARRLGARALRELAALPEKQRAALCLTAVEGLAYNFSRLKLTAPSPPFPA